MTRILTSLAVLLAFALPLQAASDRRILLYQSFANAKEKQRSPKPKRARVIEPDFAALEAPALKKNEQRKVERKLTAALFDDEIVHIELEDVERNAVDATIWSGTIEGDESSSVTIVVKDRSMVASISTAMRRFMIEPGENGVHEALELDLGGFPSELDPERPMSASALARDHVVANDSAAFIDILVVYTDDLREWLGGTAGAQAAATNAIAATNNAYQNSGVTPRVRLAGAMEVTYNDNGDLAGALYAARNVDGTIDEVHTVRNQLGADAVSMLTLYGDACGVGFVMSGTPSTGFAPSAYNVTRWSCAVGNLSFPHELGHNFGLEHDRYALQIRGQTGNPAFPYGYGYVDTAFQFRDVMAYGDACGNCTRIAYFSNPNLTYLGRPLGISYQSSPSTAADNVLALNNAASTIANFRQSVAYSPATFTDNPLVAGVTPVRLIHLTELRTAINSYRAAAGLAAFSWTTVSVGTTITAAHIQELRTALTAALPSATYANALSGSIKALDVQELRNYLD